MRGFRLGVKEKTCLFSDRGVVYLEKAQIRSLYWEDVLLGEVFNQDKCIIKGKCLIEGVVW